MNLPMLEQANEAIVLVGDERARSKSMETELETLARTPRSVLVNRVFHRTPGHALTWSKYPSSISTRSSHEAPRSYMPRSVVPQSYSWHQCATRKTLVQLSEKYIAGMDGTYRPNSSPK